MKEKTYAVITGDVIGSTQMSKTGSATWMEYLKDSLIYVGNNYKIAFSVVRGDSFQGLTEQPGSALKDAVVLRLKLISSFEESLKQPRLDARVAIGLGKVESSPDKSSRIGEMGGEAFEYSGILLDSLKQIAGYPEYLKRSIPARILQKGRVSLAIGSPWQDLNDEMNIYCLMIDRLISKWTKKECAAVMYRIQGYQLSEIGDKLGIGTSAVARRLEKTDYDLVELIIQRYSRVIKSKMDSIEEPSMDDRFEREA